MRALRPVQMPRWVAALALPFAWLGARCARAFWAWVALFARPMDVLGLDGTMSPDTAQQALEAQPSPGRQPAENGSPSQRPRRALAAAAGQATPPVFLDRPTLRASRASFSHLEALRTQVTPMAIAQPPVLADSALLGRLRARLADARAEATRLKGEKAQLFVQLLGAQLHADRSDRRQEGMARRLQALTQRIESLEADCSEEADLRIRAEATAKTLRTRMKQLEKASAAQQAEALARIEDAHYHAAVAEARADGAQRVRPRTQEDPATRELVQSMARLQLTTPNTSAPASPRGDAHEGAWEGQGTARDILPSGTFARPRAPLARRTAAPLGANKSAD